MIASAPLTTSTQREYRSPDRRSGYRAGYRRGHDAGGFRRPHVPIPLTAEGFPAAIADAPKPSPIVSVSPESLAAYPWLPARVIAGSVWRGPRHVRVSVDRGGQAAPWPRRGR